jgi:serine/threonine protein kinase
MQPDDQIAEWLVRWEEARAANQPPPALDQLPAELRPRAREGLRLLRGFAEMSNALNATAPAPPDEGPQTPPDTPRYRFKEFLARGGMGEVWRGRDDLLKRDVALKVLRQRILGDRDFGARFEEEARLVGQLQHPSIVPVYDLGELPDGRPFFVMKLIHGRTLEDLLEDRAAPPEDLPRWLRVFEEVCQAVAFAHARGLIHRDLKPSNVMLGEFGEVQVMDWGLAKVMASRERQRPEQASTPVADAPGSPMEPLSQPGLVKGTPAFMAPEQARGEAERIGKASDVFGLGGILCVILTGRSPWTLPGQARVGNPREVYARLDACGADAELVGLAKLCLAPEPESRPPDAAEVARRVKLFCDSVAERASWPAGEEASDDPDARMRFRQHALEWLRAEAETQAKRLTGGQPAEADRARRVLELIRRHHILARVRNPEAVPELSAAERQAWRQLWQDVEELLRSPDQARPPDAEQPVPTHPRT